MRNIIFVNTNDSLQTKGARTSDWLGQVKGRVLYAYDLSNLVYKRKKIKSSQKPILNSTQRIKPKD